MSTRQTLFSVVSRLSHVVSRVSSAQSPTEIEPLPSSNSGFALGSSSNTVTIAVLLNDVTRGTYWTEDLGRITSDTSESSMAEVRVVQTRHVLDSFLYFQEAGTIKSTCEKHGTWHEWFKMV